MDLVRFLMMEFFIVNYLQKMSRELLYLSYVGPIGPVWILKSEAIRENQMGAVLLHRIDEELLHRILLHSNTSLGCGPVKTGNESLTCESCKTWLAASP